LQFDLRFIVADRGEGEGGCFFQETRNLQSDISLSDSQGYSSNFYLDKDIDVFLS